MGQRSLCGKEIKYNVIKLRNIKVFMLWTCTTQWKLNLKYLCFPLEVQNLAKLGIGGRVAPPRFTLTVSRLLVSHIYD